MLVRWRGDLSEVSYLIVEMKNLLIEGSILFLELNHTVSC
jgi:hypothetical protein